MGRLALLWPDPKTPFKGELGVPKRAAWSAPLALQEVKAIGRAVGGSVNDVLLTAATGALRRYMQGLGEPVDGLNFRGVVPVNLRPADVEPDLGNKFGLVFLSLPVGIADPLERLLELKRRMDKIKGSPEAILIFGLLNFAGGAPVEVQDALVNIFGTKATGVMTNVPGPRQQLYLAGAPLDTIMFWVPQSGHLGLGVSIISYAGQVWLGVATDQGLVPDPEAIIAGFHVEFDELLKIAAAGEAPGPVQEDAIEAMVAMLKDATQKVDALLDEEKAPDYCQALTKAGQPCKNHPLPGSSFCRVHQ
jgi:WS/DGAT/MGAT family acyltransferase